MSVLQVVLLHKLKTVASFQFLQEILHCLGASLGYGSIKQQVGSDQILEGSKKSVNKVIQ